MLAQERYQIILDHLWEEGAASVSQLSALLNASEATVRRDLSVLATEGKLNKVFGGATSIRQMGLVEAHVSLRETQMYEEKDRIAAYAASIVGTQVTPSMGVCLRVSTMLVRPGSGRPMDSNVVRPMITGQPSVTRLKYCRSARRCQGIWPPRPMAPLSDTATMRFFSIIPRPEP